MRFSVAGFACVTLGFLRDPGCSKVDDPQGGPNAPCTRSFDCGSGLACVEGVCRDPDAPAFDGGPKDGGDGGG